MKTTISVLLLVAVGYFMYRRALDYGLPWEDQVVITSYESSKRYRGGSEHLYVYGQIENRTRKPVHAEVECRSLPPGLTLTPKASTRVELSPEEGLPFEVELPRKQHTTGAECKVKDWSAGTGLEEAAVRGARRLFDRLRGFF